MPNRNMQVMTSSKAIEWYTPPDLLAEIAAFLGGIDLDPARPDLDDGLGITWRGKVFLNPPYGKHMQKWIDKALTDPLDEIVMLLPCYPYRRWFQRLWQHSICFIVGALYFSGYKEPAPFGSVLVYRGPRSAEFERAFSHRGHVVIGKPAKEPVAYQLPLALVA